MSESLYFELTGEDATEQFGAALARIFIETRCFPCGHAMHSGICFVAPLEPYSAISPSTSPNAFPNTFPNTFLDSSSERACTTSLGGTQASSDAAIPASSDTGSLSSSGSLSGLYLIGDLGTGKTSFARGFVQAMPCGEKADIASPSFALCNMYDTKPPVLHCDVYRTSGALTEDLELALDDGYPFVLVEWADLIPKKMLPPHRLEIRFTGEGATRFVQLQPFGEVACRICAQYAPFIKNRLKEDKC